MAFPGPERSATAGLPAALTGLVGRERELAALGAILRDPAVRLVTLTGPGGVGKTRLAVEVAAEVADAFAGGAVLVELAVVADPGLVATTILRALRGEDGGGRPPAELVPAAIGGRELLLVLDNLEHLLPAAPLLTDLLGACPRLTILATSRIRLRLRGEHEVPVAPLSLPDLADLPGVSELPSFGAIRLWAERARAANPAFALTPANAPTVAAICHRLDGLPLAIELAAARSHALSPESILARLERRLELLVDGPRDAPARHRTMRAAVAWSYEILDAAEQALFRRLSVFAGGFTLEAAEAVGRWDGEEERIAPPHRPTVPPPLAVLDLVASLVGKSLLRPVPASGEPRYAMLETIREYGRDRLAACGEEDQVCRRHAAYFLGLVEEADRHLWGPDQPVWLDRLDAEHDNLRAALDWCLAGDPEAGLRLAGALSLYWLVRGHFGEGRRRLAALLANAPERTAARAEALAAACQLAREQGDVAGGVSLCEESLAIYRALGDRQGGAATLRTLGLLASDAGEHAQARALLEESLALSRELGDEPVVAGTVGMLGCLALVEGDHRRARACLEESLARSRRLRDRRGIGVKLGNLGHVAWDDGDDHGARKLLEEGLALSREIGNKRAAAYNLTWLGNLARSQGDDRQASGHLAEALGLFGEIGDRRGTAYGLCLRGVLAVRQGDHALGVRLMGAASSLDTVFEVQLTPRERADRDAALATARAALSEETFDRAWAAGRALPLEEAIAEARVEANRLDGSAADGGLAMACETHDLTKREIEVLRLLAARLTDREIAERLFISRRTASKHVEGILAKLGVADRRAAAAEAVRRRLA